MTIRTDDIFIYPTDTVWGIGCSLYSEKGYERIAEIKKTTKRKPLSIMFCNPKDVYDSFHFPEEITMEWLEEFFTLETTLGFPVKASQIKIPKWAVWDSDYVSIRSLQTTTVKGIYQKINTPFFTTSLNLTGAAPIISASEAERFQKMYAPDAHFLTPEDTGELSGLSSSIVFFQENLDFEIKREGRKIEEIKNHLMKLFSKRLDIE